MRVLIACEFSGIVRDAFAIRGHDAWSCDLLPCERPWGNHIQDDVLDHLEDGWDLMIAHPPCTYLCNSGVLHLSSNNERWDLMVQGVRLFQKLYYAPIPKRCIENPIMHGYAKSSIGSYTQKIQPFWFGHEETKATCLWLVGLPPLERTDTVLPIHDTIHQMPPSKNRSKDRSRTFQGIASAMADQWGGDLLVSTSTHLPSTRT